MKIFKAIWLILLGVLIVGVGLIVIASSSHTLDGAKSLSNGFEVLKHINVIDIFKESKMIDLKIGVALAVFVGPFLTLIGVLKLIIKLIF